MREVTRSALVPYTPAQMYELVDDIESYPQFVPWVDGAREIERTEDFMVGSLEMHRGGLRERFTTRNTLAPPHSISLALVEGPFRVLEGRWNFDAIGERGTRVGLWMRFEFSNAILSLLLSHSFEKSCGELVDAFVARARSVYEVH